MSTTIISGATIQGGRIIGFNRDPYINYTTLLLPGNGTNNANSHTFVDASTNNFAITRNGNTTQGTFSPFSQTGWSNYFDGSGDYLTVANATALDMGSGDFTIEFWWSPLQVKASGLFCKRTSNANYSPIYLATTSTNQLSLFTSTSGSSWATNSTTTATFPVNGKWVHVAVVRYSNNMYLYANGESVLSPAAISGALMTNTAPFVLCANEATATNNFACYISEFRIVKGTAVYTSNFTPPTSPLTPISGTSLLTCQSNRFVDNSSSPLTLTVAGNPSVVAFSPFIPSAMWSPTLHGGSGYFDGTGDYLSVPDNAALDIGGSDFSIETWVYITNLAGSSFHAVYAKRNGLPGYTFGIKNSGVLFTWNGSTEVNTSGITLAEKTWYHLVWSSVSGTLRMFVNGTSYYSASYSISTNSYAPTIGASAGASGGVIADYLFGYVSGFKLVKGTGVTSVTVPTQPPTATGSNLLLNFTNAGIYDATSRNNLETVGDAKISTAESKWGGSSMAFDGTGDYLLSQASNDLYAFGSGDFTIELWLRLNNVSGQKNIYESNPTSTIGLYPIIYILNTTLYYFTNGSNRITAGTALSADNWYHIAVARSGTSTKLFLNGTQEGSTYTDSNVYINGGAGRPVIGGSGYTLGSSNLNGYIQDLRVTKGIARYTANFPVPNYPHPTF